MDNDPKFTRGWRAAIVIALLLSIAATGFKITIGPFKFGRSFTSDDQLSEVQKRADQAEERIKKIEAYLYERAPAK